MRRVLTLLLAPVMALLWSGWALAQAGHAPILGFEVVRSYPHDVGAFTEGLFFKDGVLFESTGLKGRSDIRKVELETGKVLQRRALDARYFGEGIIDWDGRLIELTWQDGIGFIYDLKTFAPLSSFRYEGEGWALTRNDRQIIMSDGTDEIRFLDPATLKETGRISVSDVGGSVPQINELEWVEGEIWANIWQSNYIARIDPVSGRVIAWIDMSGLLSDADRRGGEDVLNGIAYDAVGKRLFVTGKFWPKLYEIRVVERQGVAEPRTE